MDFDTPAEYIPLAKFLWVRPLMLLCVLQLLKTALGVGQDAPTRVKATNRALTSAGKISE